MLLQDGAFAFTLSNLVVGAIYVIQASTNLANWSSLVTNVAASSVENWQDNERRPLGGAFTELRICDDLLHVGGSLSAASKRRCWLACAATAVMPA